MSVYIKIQYIIKRYYSIYGFRHSMWNLEHTYLDKEKPLYLLTTSETSAQTTIPEIVFDDLMNK